MKQILIVVAVVLALLAGLSAFLTGVNISEVGLLAFSLAAYFGKDLVT